MDNAPSSSAQETTTNSAPAIPGFAWYGKMPSVGDFISRRMPYPLQQFWDHWAAGGLESLKASSMSSGWDIWRGSPKWAFILPVQPGIPLIQMGVLAPSCDRVGRIFPFLVTLPLPHDRLASYIPCAASLGLAWGDVIAQAQMSRLGIEEIDARLASALADALSNPATAEDSEKTLPQGMNPLTLPWADLASTFDGQGGEGFWWSVPPANTAFRARTHTGALNSMLFLGLFSG